MAEPLAPDPCPLVPDPSFSGRQEKPAAEIRQARQAAVRFAFLPASNVSERLPFRCNGPAAPSVGENEARVASPEICVQH